MLFQDDRALDGMSAYPYAVSGYTYPHVAGEAPWPGPLQMYASFSGTPVMEVFPDTHWVKYYRASEVRWSPIERCPNHCEPTGARVLSMAGCPRRCVYCHAEVVLSFGREEVH